MIMKNKIWYYPLIIMGIFLVLSGGCKKKKDENSNVTIPELTTWNVTDITPTSVECGGDITSGNIESLTASGLCWSTGSMPTIADNTNTLGDNGNSFSINITGLTPNTIYYVRAYATNSAGTGYGNVVMFRTHQEYSGTMTDIDGHVYDVMTIGTQEWMAENLKVTHYRNGDPISNITDGTAWSNLTTEAYCAYNNYLDDYAHYGELYNWYAVTDSRNIAPIGWHVPTDADWAILTDYLGGAVVAGGKLKETGTYHWQSPNTGATDESGFTALPGGNRQTGGVFSNKGESGGWWSSTEVNASEAFCLFMSCSNSGAYKVNYDKKIGYSVRCVKD
jgi:uncharacterized protein (TIGR02145 family)